MTSLYPQAIVSGLLIGGVYSLVGIGLTLVFGVMRVINFAHGEIMMVSMYLSYVLFQWLGLDPFLSIVVTAPAMFAFGVLLQKLFIARALRFPQHNQILLTIGLGLIMTNVAMLVFTSDYKLLTTPYSSTSIHPLGLSISKPLLFSFLITAAITASLYAFLGRTDTGRAMRATAQDREAARLMGIPVERTSTLAFGLGCALAGIAGSLITPTYYIFPQVGGGFTLKAFVVTVLGGMGSVIGATIGGLIIGVAESVGAVTFQSGWKDVVVYTLFLVILLVKPSGLFGKTRM